MWLCKRDLSKECEGKYSDCTDCVLDKIRTEILAMMPPLGIWMYDEGHIEEQTACEVIADVVQIIDKYKAESEGRNEQKMGQSDSR